MPQCHSAAQQAVAAPDVRMAHGAQEGHPGTLIIDVHGVHESLDSQHPPCIRCPKKRGAARPIRAVIGWRYLRRTARTPPICATTRSTCASRAASATSTVKVMNAVPPLLSRTD